MSIIPIKVFLDERLPNVHFMRMPPVDEEHAFQVLASISPSVVVRSKVGLCRFKETFADNFTGLVEHYSQSHPTSSAE